MGEENHREGMLRDFRRRFYVSLIVTVPILFLSPTLQDWFGFELVFTGSNYVILGLASFIYFYGGWPFLRGIYDELKERSPGMMTLISVAISVAYFYSAAVVFGLEGTFFFWELATLIDVMLAGHWIEMRSVMSASRSLEELAKLMPSEAHLIKDSGTVDVEIKKLSKGDWILVKPGEKIPADGEVIDGDSYVDESMLTGESQPVSKEEGNEVIGGSINGEGSLKIEIKKAGDDSYLSEVINLVREAQESKSKTQRLADRAALYLTIIALTAGLMTLITWLTFTTRDFQFAIGRMATVMVITCPHALGLAIPLVSAVSTSLSARNGLLIRNRTAFENSRKITTVIFDKTGTLTEGVFEVNEIRSIDDYDRDEVLRLTAALEQNSEHPIATGIMKKVEEESIDIPSASDFQAIKGKGVEGKVEDRSVKVVGPNYLEENSIEVSEKLEHSESATVVYLIVDGQLIGSVSLSDRIREDSYEAVERLKGEGIKVWMLTGDNKATAKEVSEELGLDGYSAQVLPDEKQEWVKKLQAEGEFIAMTGDGVNDAPALAQADVGVAIGSGTDVAAETADIILVESNPADVTKLILFGRATYKKMIQNLFWATGYNAFAIPLAAGVAAGWGIIMPPAIGALLMSVSTVIVAINARMLRI